MIKSRSNADVVPRRTVLGMAFVGALAGSIWGTGFTVLSRSRHPVMMVSGDRDWQVALIESVRCRVLVVIGSPDVEISETLARLLGSLRQRLDMVIGTQTSLEGLPAQYRSQWSVSRTLVLGGVFSSSPVSTSVAITNGMSIALPDEMLIGLSPLVRDEWGTRGDPADSTRRWVVTVQCRGAVVGIAELIDHVIESGLSPLSVAMAPKGEIKLLQSREPGSALAMNAANIPADLITTSEPGNDGSFWVAPVFPEDVARFEFTRNGLGLPAWSRTVHTAESSHDHSSRSDA